jgi:hypothetical protein
MAENRGARKSRGPVSLGDDEAALGMGVGARIQAGVEAGKLVVMAAQRRGNLAQGDGSFRTRLPLPEESEAMAAYGTAEIRGINNALAQNLHVFFWPFVVPCSNCNGETLALVEVS